MLAALIAVQQNDIKRILAYSTLSQLGYMVMAVGLGGPTPAMFHLTTHAFFKALLFLGAGSVIHRAASRAEHLEHGRAAKEDAGDLLDFPRSARWRWRASRRSAVSTARTRFWPQALRTITSLCFCLGVFVAVLTTFYMFRLVFVAFFGQPAISGRAMPTNRPGS